MDAAEGWFSPADADDVDSCDLVTTLREHMKAQDALVLGRVIQVVSRVLAPKQTGDTTASPSA